MKKSLIVLSAILLVLPGCKKAAPAGLASIWFTGTEETTEKSIYVDGPSSASFSVTSSVLASKDVTIGVEIDAAALDKFNSDNGTDYKMLPAGSYELADKKLTISAHKNVSAPGAVKILKLDDFEAGTTYCIPLHLTSASDGEQILRASEYLYYIIKTRIHTSGSDFNYNSCYHVPSMMNVAALSDLPACTMEIRVKMDAFRPETHNPGIATLIGVEEMFLLRFGDISCKKNQLQLAGRGVSITSKTEFETDRWYHIAVVDDRNTARLYVDGELDTEVSSAGKSAIDLSNTWQDGFWIGDSCKGRKMDGTVSEARVWARALSPIELTNNQCIIANPEKAAKEDKLIGYWKLDAENKGKDFSGNNYEAVESGSVEFVEGVVCPPVE